ncbi:hypothetical protein [Spirosoma agri]|uniref:Uncharacterized protein n=1 Tax=Spirosoma agri TaxID=1987381 RepID=A0A6M0ICW0_9BACT|nr:hypothetical protein [Spirosoma agri]
MPTSDTDSWDKLLQIRLGAFKHNDLIKRAEQKVAQVEAATAISPLPDRPDLYRIEQLLVTMRTAVYLADQ